MKLPFQIDLTGKTAVVTGGAGVLCGEFCRALGACGARVAIADRQLEQGRLLAEEIRASGGQAEAFAVDVTDRAAVEALRNAVLERFGLCEILINGAGGNQPGATTDDEYFSREIMENPEKKSFFDLDPEGFSQALGLNLTGTLLVSQRFGRDMAERGRGAIVNISSLSAIAPLTKVPAYSAAKAAVSSLTQWLAVYLAKSGVRVNAIAPGFILSEQNRPLLRNPDGTPTARAEKVAAATPMGRFGSPEELIGTLLWLLDERSASFVTGIVVPVDGGYCAYSGV